MEATNAFVPEGRRPGLYLQPCKTAMNARKVLGGGKEGISSGEEGEDNGDRELFLEEYREMHRFRS